MYDNYFKLSCFPFENTLDQRFFFLSEGHREVIAALLYFVREKKGFAMVCGDVGAGKTMIVRHFLSRLPDSVLPIVIPYPDVEYLVILHYIARALGMKEKNKDALELTDALKARLAMASAQGKQVVLIIDEAHALPVESLEQIRLLSNMELPEKKLLQILLIGQNELAVKLRRPQLRQLRQRININRVLSPMNPFDTISYIGHRLKIAGSDFEACFDPDCVRLLYKLTQGVPRDINRLCDTALLICMAHQSQRVTERILKRARNAMTSDSAVPAAKSFSDLSRYALKFGYALGASVLGLLLAAQFSGRGMHSGNLSNSLVHQSVAKLQTDASRTKPRGSAVQRKIPAKPELKPIATTFKPADPEHAQTPAPSQALEVPKAIPAVPQSAAGSEKADRSGGGLSTPSRQEGAKTQPPGVATPKDPVLSRSPSQQAAARPTSEAPKAKESPAAADPPRPAFRLIRVKKGESLSKIAAKWFPDDPASGLKQIMAANPLIHDKNMLLIDQALKIPGKN